MLYVLIFVYMIIFPITMISLLYKILDKLEKNEPEKPIIENAFKKKKHPTLGQSNYKSTLTGRKNTYAYDKYKNKEGLYEPVNPHNGIQIKKKEA